MKKFFLLMLVAVTMLLSSNSYALDTFWQNGVALDNVGQIVDNVTLDVRITIYDAGGNQLYQQTFAGVETSQFAVFQVEVDGSGTGNFAAINADAGTMIKVETDAGSGWVLSSMQMMSFAQYNTTVVPGQIGLTEHHIIIGDVDDNGEDVAVGGVLTASNDGSGTAVFEINHDQSLQVVNDILGINHGYENHWEADQYFQNIYPEDDNTYDLGNDGARWRDLWLGGSYGQEGPFTIHIGETNNEATIEYDLVNRDLVITSPDDAILFNTPHTVVSDDFHVGGNAYVTGDLKLTSDLYFDAGQHVDEIVTVINNNDNTALPTEGAVYNLTTTMKAYPYITVGNVGDLTAERAIATDATLTGTDGGANGSYTLGIDLTNDNSWTGTQTFADVAVTGHVLSDLLPDNSTGRNLGGTGVDTWTNIYGVTGHFAHIQVSGTSTLGDQLIDNVILNGTVSSSLGDIIVNDNIVPTGTHDLGTSGSPWDNVYANTFHGAMANDLTDGNGIADFTYNGSAAAIVTVDHDATLGMTGSTPNGVLGIDLANPNSWTGTQTFSDVDINGGAIDGTVIGGSAPAAGAFTTLTAMGNTLLLGQLDVFGTTTLGNANTDNVVFNADVNSNIIPNTTATYDLGSDAQRWGDLYISGASIHMGVSGDEGVMGYNTTNNEFTFDKSINVTGQVQMSGHLNVGGDVWIGQATEITGDLVVNSDIIGEGNTILGSNNADNVVFNADVNSNIIPNTTATYDLGSDAQRWRELYLSGASIHMGASGDEVVISYGSYAGAYTGNVLTVGNTPVSMPNIFNNGNAHQGVIGQLGEPFYNIYVDYVNSISGTFSGDVYATTFNGDLDGNATTATALQNARDFSVSGDVATSANVSFNGTGDVDLAVSFTPGAIVNADINPSAGIAVTKLAAGSDGDVLYTTGGVPTWSALSSIETDPVWTAAEPNYANLGQAETITGNWDNTANPWADNEVADALTIDGGTVTNSTVTPGTGHVTADYFVGSGSTSNAVDLATAEVNGTLPIVNGGTGATTAGAAINNLLPSQTGNSGKFLTTDGTNPSWADEVDGSVTNEVNTGMAWNDGTNTVSVTDPNSTQSVVITGFLETEVDGVIGNEVRNATNATLVRSGAGTSGDPYTLAINLGNTNTWTGAQTFNTAVINSGTIDNTAIGGTTPSTGAFTDLSVTNNVLTSLIPDATLRNLGSDANRWGSLYLTGASIHMGSSGNETVIGYNGANITMDKTIYLNNGTGNWLIYEGTADAFETAIGFTDPTADHTLTFPDETGTILTDNTSISSGDVQGSYNGGFTIQPSSVNSSKIADGAIMDADVNVNAEIAVSKLANGTAGQILTTDGTNVSWGSEGDGVVGNEVTNATNATLVRSGAGTSGDPYTLAINLGNTNTWTGAQTFNTAVINSGSIDNTPIGGTTPSTGAFTTLSTSSNATVGGNATVTGDFTASADVQLSYNSGTVSGDAITVPDNIVVYNITSDNNGTTDVVTLPTGANGEILYLAVVSTSTDDVTVGTETITRTAAGTIGVTLVYANGSWIITGTYEQ